MKDITNHALRAHVHPSGFAHLCCCFETLFCPMQCFDWLTHLMGCSLVFMLGQSVTLHILKTAIFNYAKTFFGAQGVQCILGEHGPLKGHFLIEIIFLCWLHVRILVDDSDKKCTVVG